jgi:hypothetical protein
LDPLSTEIIFLLYVVSVIFEDSIGLTFIIDTSDILPCPLKTSTEVRSLLVFICPFKTSVDVRSLPIDILDVTSFVKIGFITPSDINSCFIISGLML